MKDFFKGIGINFFITVIIALTSFVVNQKFSYYMGIENLGTMKLFSQLIAYLSLADLGLGSAATYALYKPLSDRNIYKLSSLMTTIKRFYRKISLIILFVGLILTPFLEFFMGDIKVKNYIYIYWILYVVNTVLSYSYAQYVVLLTADQKYSILRVIQGMSKIICQLLQIYELVYFKSFYIFIFMLILDNLIQFVILKLYYKKKYNYIYKVYDKESTLKKNMLYLFFHKIGGIIVFNTDYIIISRYISVMMVGLYSNYIMIYNLIITLISIITNVLNPKIGEYIAKNSNQRIYDLYKKVNYFYMYIGIICFIITYFSINPFIYLWLGKEYLLEINIVILILINLFISIVTSSIWLFKMNSGYFNDIYLPLAEGVLNLVFSIIFVKKYGVKGVILGTIITNIIFNFFIKSILVYKNCFKKTIYDYIKSCLEMLIVVLIVIMIIKNINFKISFLSWEKWMIDTICMSFKLILLISPIALINLFYKKLFKNRGL